MADDTNQKSINDNIDAVEQDNDAESILKETIIDIGNAAENTSKQFEDFTQKEENIIIFSKSVTETGEAMLLTFNNIGNSIIPQTSQSFVNLSQIIENTKAAVQRFSSALSIPIQELKSLTDANTAFSNSQKETAKQLTSTGSIIVEQKSSLSEFNKNLGNETGSSSKTFKDNMKQVENALRGLKSSMKSGIVPTIKTLSSLFKSSSDKMKNFNSTCSDIESTFSNVQKIFNTTTGTIKKINAVCDGVADRMLNIGSSMKKAVKQIKSGVETVEIVCLYAKDHIKSGIETIEIICLYAEDHIKGGFEKLGNGIKYVFDKLPEGIKTDLKQIETKCTNLGNSVKKIFSDVSKSINDKIQNVKKIFSGIGNGIINEIKSGIQNVEISFALLTDKVNENFKKIQKVGKSIFSKLPFDVQYSLIQVETKFTSAANKIKGLIGKLASKLSALPGLLSKLPASLGKLQEKIIKSLSVFGPKVIAIFQKLGSKMTSGLIKLINIGLKLIAPAAIVGVILLGLGLVENKMGKQIDAIAKKYIAKGPAMIQTFTANLVAQIPQLITAGTTLFNTLLNVLIANAPSLLKAATAIITSLVNGVSTNLPRLIPEVIKLIETILNAIVQNLPTIIMAGLKLILALVQGISSNISQIVNSIVQVIVTIINVMSQHLPQIIEVGIQILVAIVGGLLKAIPQLIAAIPQIIEAIWNGIKSVNWLELGGNIIDGLIKGIEAGVAGLWDTMKNLAKGAISIVKSFLGIHSPSRVFADEIGKFIPAGVGVGIEENSDTVISSLGNMSKKMVDSMQNNKISILGAARELSNMNFQMGLMPRAAEKLNGKDSINQSARSGGITQNITINSNTPLSPSEIIRKQKQASRELALQWGF